MAQNFVSIGGDWKFLATTTGIDSATHNHACIWCKCTKEERYNPDKVWSFMNTNDGACTVEENIEIQ